MYGMCAFYLFMFEMICVILHYAFTCEKDFIVMLFKRVYIVNCLW